MHTLSEDVHWIVYLYVHVVANSRELLSFGRDDPSILTLDLVRGGTFLGEAPRNDDASAIVLRAIRLFALVLQNDRHLRDSVWV